MRAIYQLNNKKGISDMIAYVILISITISLSVLVYGWLRFQFGGEELKECPDGINIVLKNYDCPPNNAWLSIELKNKGRFTIDGYVLRVHNRSDAEFGIYTIAANGFKIAPGESWGPYQYNFTGTNDETKKLYDPEIQNMGAIRFIEVQPYILQNNKKLMCKSLSTQDIKCSSA